MCDTQPTTRDPQFQQQQIHGCVNNAGRFRSEVHLLNSSRKKRTSQSLGDNPLLNSNRSSKLADSQVADSAEDDGLFQITGLTPESGTIDAIKSAQSVETTLNPTGQNEAYYPVGDYFLFDFLPYAPLGSGTSSAKPHPTPVHLENPERETRWYFKYFLGKFHQLYCGYVNDRDPFLLAVAKTDVRSYGISQYRAILWRKSGSQKLCISYNPTTSLTAKKVLNFFDIQRIEKGPKEVYNYEVQKDALTLEEQEGSVNFKFGVIYCIEGQTSDEDMYNNEHGSEEFNQFIKLLGDRINLKSWDRFKGGLDTKSNTTGIDSVYTVYEGHEIMFHVSTLLPFSTENRQQIERKRHVGNDIVNIIFVDGIEPDAQPSWMPSMMKTHFTHIFAIVTYCKKSSTYRLNVFAEESVPIFGPPLPSPPEFTNPQEFREFLLVKLINGEKAAFHSPVFAQKRERTLEMLLHVICSANMNETSSVGLARRTFSDVVTDSFNGITTGKEQMRHDAHIKFGQMLKLNTIIRGDAPTSCITSGQAKKKPWQPKHFHTPLQYEVNCADVWNGNLIVSTENGTFLLKELCQPVLFIDRSVEVRQLEVTEQNEMLVIRYDKNREARVSVIPLADRDFGQQLDKTQVRKMSLEKSKGCHLFALNKSIIHPMKMAIVVHKRIFIYQWQIVTGQSLSSWNQIAQSNTPDNFQVIREIPILDPVQTICFLDGIPGGRICVGHRNQFDLIDERNREILPLFRTESSRNQVVSAHEFWEDDEPELLLCFTRTCHFQKLTQMQTCNSVMRKLQSLSSSGSETTGSSNNSSSTLHRLADQSFSPSTSALFPNASMDSSSAGTPDWTTSSPLPTSSGSSEKCKANEFDFTWNFTPEQVEWLLFHFNR
ncbi:hypothetical protein CRM22_003444 [Opisthorchis felineus]|uniref:GTPase-activating Rap/Ran-GAP domain-like protein 3 n=1 Tax=Opisthorchis felineus TaxID=147828 RepID=A0A4S2M157_OPIFE|nr:hypothetical protein CRM22_003444 [Opisthorchis felineus]